MVFMILAAVAARAVKNPIRLTARDALKFAPFLLVWFILFAAQMARSAH